MRRMQETEVSNFFKNVCNCMTYKKLYDYAGLEELSLHADIDLTR